MPLHELVGEDVVRHDGEDGRAAEQPALAAGDALAQAAVGVPCQPNKKNSTVKTDQNQLNKKSTHQKSIHQNVNFTTFELNKSQLNK